MQFHTAQCNWLNISQKLIQYNQKRYLASVSEYSFLWCYLQLRILFDVGISFKPKFFQGSHFYKSRLYYLVVSIGTNPSIYTVLEVFRHSNQQIYSIWHMNTISYIKIRIKIVFCRNYAQVHLFLSTPNTPNQNTLYLKIRICITKLRFAKSKIRSYLLPWYYSFRFIDLRQVGRFTKIIMRNVEHGEDHKQI